MPDKDTSATKLAEKLFSKSVNAWDSLNAADEKKLQKYNDGYRKFLDDGKTEREAVNAALVHIKAAGYKDLTKSKNTNKVFYNHYGKSLAIYRAGKKPLADGLNIIVAHLDSPRLDVKQNPLYEDTEIALLKTHYYGGIKKYQWVSRPLAIHGRVSMADGRQIDVVLGEDDKEPVFSIADLLPHLARKAQMKKSASDFIPGEKLNVVIGSRPFGKNRKDKTRFKLHVMKILNDKYGITEADFLSADLEVVPSGKSRELGIDASMIAAYGQDDRVCSFAALKSLLDTPKPTLPSLILLMDKEEIGSEGATGSNTWFIEMVIGKVLEKNGIDSYNTLMSVLSGASCLSADVNAATHPDWKDVHDKMNAGYLGHGLVLAKFTGSGGKGGSNEANAEFLGRLRKVLDSNKIAWHMAELGKVDEGGGGTIAKFMAYYGMNVIDAGVPVLDMHSPFEITSKVDNYMMYKAFIGFLNDMK